MESDLAVKAYKVSLTVAACIQKSPYISWISECIIRIFSKIQTALKQCNTIKSVYLLTYIQGHSVLLLVLLFKASFWPLSLVHSYTMCVKLLLKVVINDPKINVKFYS